MAEEGKPDTTDLFGQKRYTDHVIFYDSASTVEFLRRLESAGHAAGKYGDGTPLYRMAHALARAVIEVGRGTLANWIIRPAELHYSRLYEALRRTLLSQPLIHGDETTVQVLKEPGKAAQSTSYMWVYRSAEGCAQPVVLFDYQPERGQEHPQAFLAGYQGLLMTDGYAAWRTLEGPTHFGCLAHARRAFVDALKGMKKPGGRAAQALEYFKALYQVEALAKADLPEGKMRVNYTYQLRQQHCVPLLEAFRKWLDEQAPQVLPESLLGKAISYTRNQWTYNSRYVSDGHAPVDNNVIERDIRPFCTGRSSWLFSDTVAGAKASAIVYSLMLTCRACNVEPYAYLVRPKGIERQLAIAQVSLVEKAWSSNHRRGRRICARLHHCWTDSERRIR